MPLLSPHVVPRPGNACQRAHRVIDPHRPGTTIGSRCSAVFHTATLMLLCWAATVGMALAQTPTPPLELPNLRLTTDGIVYAIARQPDGGVVVGGSFQYVKGIPRRNLARLMPDGTVDSGWNPAPDNPVRTLAVDGTGAVYVGGSFWQIGGQSRNRLAKLSGSGAGSVDSAWNPNADGQVSTLALDGNGNVYAGGSFTSIGGQPRNRIAKISGAGAGTVDSQWNPSANNEVNTLAVDADGMLYAGGRFTEIGGQSRSRIAKISGTGMGAADPAWNPSANNTVNTIVIGGGGAIYAGGIFTQIGGQTRRYLAKILGTGTGALEPVWNPNFHNSTLPNTGVYCIALDTAGEVYVGGAFDGINGHARNYLAKLSGDGAGEVDPDWHPAPTGYVTALAVDESGATHVGGSFRQIGGQPRYSLARLDGDGNALESIDAENTGSVSALALQPDGGLVVGGRFERVDGMPRQNLFRLRPDRTLDPDWDISADSVVWTLATAADGTVYAGGSFSYIAGQYRPRLAKISASGAVQTVWAPSTNGQVEVMALGADGSVYVGGNFSQAGGLPRNRLAKISSSGSGEVDPDWNPSADNRVLALAASSDGAVYAAGQFTQIGGQSRNYLAKLSAGGTGTADPDWNPSPDDRIYSLATDASGAVYAGGDFYQIGGVGRPHLAKLSGSGPGAVDVDWTPWWNSTPYSLALGANDTVYVGGRSVIGKISGSTGASDANWYSSLNGVIYGAQALVVDAGGIVHAGGDFTEASGQQRMGLAALPPFVPSSDARLSALTPGTGTLSPSFTPDGTTYSLAVVHAVSSIAFTPVALDPAATIIVNGQPVASGTPSPLVSLTTGNNSVSILVTAEDGIAQREYIVDVVRLSAQPVALSVTIARLPNGFAMSGGEMRYYRITATNLGHQSADNVQLTAPLPVGLTDVLWTCAAPTECTPAQGEDAVAVTFPLGSGQSAHVDLSGEVLPGVAFIDLRASASAASAGVGAQGSVSEPANGIGVLKNGFED